jgi:hypothetical protein
MRGRNGVVTLSGRVANWAPVASPVDVLGENRLEHLAASACRMEVERPIRGRSASRRADITMMRDESQAKI